MQERHHQKPIANIFRESKNELADLINKVNRLQHLNQYLQKILDIKLSRHCQIANFENGILTLVTDNSNWATQIRYSMPNIMEQLKKIPSFHELKTIRCIISPILETS